MKFKKYHLWLLLFFTIFGFTFGMIIWTVKSAVNTPVYEDRSFLSTYHLVDNNYNQMMVENSKFLNCYNIIFNINGHKVGLETDDVFLGQRSLEKKHKHRDFLKVGENSISVSIKERNSSIAVPNAQIELLLTRAIENNGDLNINSFIFKDNLYTTVMEIPIKGHWNLTGKITINNKKGYFFIKTNTKK
jgi:hypothetical protein